MWVQSGLLVQAARPEPLPLGLPRRSPLITVASKSWLANHTRGQLAVGGRLSLADDRLVFVPNWFEKVLRGGSWTCQLAAITGVGVADRGLNPVSGAWRRRLVVVHDGREDYFVVNHVNQIVDAIELARSAG